MERGTNHDSISTEKILSVLPSTMFTIALTLLGLLSASVSRASPLTQIIGGPPPGIYGTNFTKSGPVDQGPITFPKQADQHLSVDAILFQNLLSAEWIVQDL
jgi:hypothetical protein